MGSHTPKNLRSESDHTFRPLTPLRMIVGKCGQKGSQATAGRAINAKSAIKDVLDCRRFTEVLPAPQQMSSGEFSGGPFCSRV